MDGSARKIESKLLKTNQKRLICWAFDLISIFIVSLVLGNGLAGAEPLQVSSVTVLSAPSNGAATINPVDGSIQYIPGNGICGI
jgi:hypothetical protein